MINPILEKLDPYIVNNFNVRILKYDWGNIFADETHFWGLTPVHYHKITS